jgi:hypothetical protein
MATQVSIVNQSLEWVGDQVQITAFDDGSAAAQAASVLYTPTVQMLLRDLDPAFALRTIVLAPQTGITAPIPPWAFEYVYPADCLRIRSLRPKPGTYDPNNPYSIRFQVAFDVASAQPAKVIGTNEPNALVVYTTSSVTENQWDAAFTDALVRRLAGPLAMALAGRPDFARELLDEAARSAAVADAVDEY